MDSGTLLRVCAAALALLLTLGCSVPIAANLAEQEANEAIVALEAAGVVAAKEPDPSTEGRWQLSVPQGDAVAAVSVLSEQNLPFRSAPGVLQAMGQGSLVPSRTLEHTQWLAGTAGDLESSLRSIDGVLSARVHLAAPAKDAFDLNDALPDPSASVLFRHRGATPPIATGDVQRLVAGAVPGLSPERVDVISSTAPPLRKRPDRLLAQLGPITVTQASLTPLKSIVAGAIALNVLLVGVLGWFWLRSKKQLARLAELEGGPARAGEP